MPPGSQCPAFNRTSISAPSCDALLTFIVERNRAIQAAADDAEGGASGVSDWSFSPKCIISELGQNALNALHKQGDMR